MLVYVSVCLLEYEYNCTLTLCALYCKNRSSCINGGLAITKSAHSALELTCERTEDAGRQIPHCGGRDGTDSCTGYSCISINSQLLVL